MENTSAFSRTDTQQFIAGVLRRFVGHGRTTSWDDLASATGVKVGTLRSYVEECGPNIPGDVLLHVLAVLPEGAIASVARRIGYSVAPLDVDATSTVRRALAGAARLVADGTEALDDGALSPSERAKLAQAAGALLPALQAMAAMEAVA